MKIGAPYSFDIAWSTETYDLPSCVIYILHKVIKLKTCSGYCSYMLVLIYHVIS